MGFLGRLVSCLRAGEYRCISCILGHSQELYRACNGASGMTLGLYLLMTIRAVSLFDGVLCGGSTSAIPLRNQSI